MIRIEGLSKRFGSTVAVENLWLEIAPGELFGFLGPNGAGKTTTIRMLTGLIGPSSGRAWVAGHLLGEDDTELRRQVGILTEAPGLYDTLSAERNLTFFAELYGVTDIAGQVERYLRLLGLWNRRSEPTATFSRGMRQKLAIARALLHEPRVLFLDEPTTGLDPVLVNSIHHLIVGLHRTIGFTAVMVSHEIPEIFGIADRVAMLHDGRIRAVGTPAEVQGADDPVVRQFINGEIEEEPS
jgi:ABC-2 type transport system ATP-binding protein